MQACYKKLWKILIDRGMNKKDLARVSGVSSFTITKMAKGENVTVDTLGKICAVLGCGVGDIMEFIPDEIESVTVHSLDEFRVYLVDRDWSVFDCGIGPDFVPGWELSKHSPAGEDFSFAIEHGNDVERAIAEISSYASVFDINEHVEMWVNARGSVSGVPDAVTLIQDAKDIKAMLAEIAEHVSYAVSEG